MEPVASDLTEMADEPSLPTSTADPAVTTTEPTVAHREIAEWHGRELIDCDGERIGKLEDVYYDVETEEPQFGTVKEGLIGRHLTFVPLVAVTIGPDNLQVTVSKEQVKKAPNIGLNDLSQVDESNLYHHYQLNYTPLDTESGRRLARR
jgi:sporulation protein YlmC with PRC-barrel domain